MDFKIYHIPTQTKGDLYLFPAPIANRVESFAIDGLTILSVQVVVNLLSLEECVKNQFEKQEDSYHTRNIKLIHFPIDDYGTPRNLSEFKHLIERLQLHLEEGSNVAVHCFGGIGRSSLVGVSLLFKLGMSVDEAIGLISKFRQHQVPDTQVQKDWLKDFNK